MKGPRSATGKLILFGKRLSLASGVAVVVVLSGACQLFWPISDFDDRESPLSVAPDSGQDGAGLLDSASPKDTLKEWEEVTQESISSNHPCKTDTQCSPSESCQVVANKSNTGLELRCLGAVGANSNGDACTQDNQCASGICLGGFCTTPCTTVEDCPQASLCEAQTIQEGLLSGSFSVCVTVPCTSNQQCEGGQLCSGYRKDAAGHHRYCRTPSEAGELVGNSCTADSECQSYFCPGLLPTCSVFCDTAKDCPASPNMSCVDLLLSTPPLRTCARTCARPADCAPPMVCAPWKDSVAKTIWLVCGLPTGSDKIGSPCSDNCESRLCLSKGSGNPPLCTQPCVTNADCPPAFPDCVTANAPDNYGGTVKMQMCINL